jgi:hypothetical protein
MYVTTEAAKKRSNFLAKKRSLFMRLRVCFIGIGVFIASQSQLIGMNKIKHTQKLYKKNTATFFYALCTPSKMYGKRDFFDGPDNRRPHFDSVQTGSVRPSEEKAPETNKLSSRMVALHKHLKYIEGQRKSILKGKFDQDHLEKLRIGFKYIVKTCPCASATFNTFDTNKLIKLLDSCGEGLCKKKKVSSDDRLDFDYRYGIYIKLESIETARNTLYRHPLAYRGSIEEYEAELTDLKRKFEKIIHENWYCSTECSADCLDIPFSKFTTLEVMKHFDKCIKGMCTKKE